jgi:hypothetical protein
MSGFAVTQEFARPNGESFSNWRILPRMILSKSFPARVALCAVLAFVLIACGAGRKEYFYKTLADADEAGEITRGWIPDDLMPASSRAIHLAEELSPSREWCAFEFVPGDMQRLRGNLKSIDVLPESVRRIPSPSVSWWPAMLKGSLDVRSIHDAGFEVYTVVRPATSVTMGVYLFAVDSTRGRGFFYMQ